jgi:hypothetical protein
MLRRETGKGVCVQANNSKITLKIYQQKQCKSRTPKKFTIIDTKMSYRLSKSQFGAEIV